MQQSVSNSAVAVLVSGGLDSCILVSILLEQGHLVQPIYIQSQLVWERAELAALRRYLEKVQTSGLQPLVTLELPLTDLYGEHWSLTGRATPRADDPDEAVFLPGRNLLLLIKAGLWCQLHGIGELALGVLGTSPFPDAQPAFCQHFQSLLECGGRPPIHIVLPLSGWDKHRVMALGRQQPLELTFSCLAPVGDLHCGRCNKCAERQAGFRTSGQRDRTVYAFPGPTVES